MMSALIRAKVQRKAKGLVVFFLLALILSACKQRNENSASSVDVSGIALETGNQRSWSRHVCGISPERMEFCPTDFTRLATYPIAADGKEVWILGYLAIDGGHVVLFATEEDYLDMQYGKSIRVLGSREQLEEIFTELGYRKVRLKGKFRANSFDDPRNDRLGELLSPVIGQPVFARSDMEGVRDIRVDVRDQQ
jgi:hypothetical protein